MVRAAGGRAGDWTFLTNHGHVLLALARDPQARLRDVADLIGITERSVQAIVADLEAEGYLTRIRVGRRNVYRLHPQRRFRHPAESRHRIGELLDLFTERPLRRTEVDPAGESETG
jgi:DNA-binding MarR family transcriptional regulator